ncbi:MAG: PAS domain S-box protein, partial [Planctomycetes bacterium]|nr:PAS domain S-box protein [Planctomycetota bacterium]
FVITADRHLVNVNAAAERTFGYSKDELADNSTEILHIDHDHYLEFGKRIQRAFDRSETACLEFELKRKNGEVFPTEHTVSLLKNDAGKTIGIVSVVRDITERKRSERRLQEAENRYRMLFDQLPDAVVLIDPDTTLPIEFNHLAPRLLGYSPAEFAKLRVADYDANESPEQVREHVERVLRHGRDEFETRMRTKDGSIRDVVVRVRLAEISGRPVFHSIFRDVTERKKTEEEIRRLATALEAAGEAALITDTQGIIEYVNPAFETLYGFTRAQALGKTPRILKSGQHDAAFYEQLWATIAARRVWRSEIINRCGDGTLIEVEETIAPVCSPSGELTGYVSLARDVSERKEAEQRARSQEAEMARMARMSTLGELATGIAHEVNQPLAAIVNFTGAALQRVRAGDVQSDELCHTLEQTAEMAERAGQIIHRIRDLVRKDDPRRSATDLNELLRESLALLSGRIRAGDVSLVLELTENLPPVSVDAIQIQQVILNLVHNAVEALGQPGLKKHQVILQTQRSQGGAEVIVKDTGPGIDPAVADRLFEPFVTTKGEGLGMGLPISASIIRAHNGRLWHVHEDGGAAFHFTLPSV